jgi:uncharacterized protein (DUF433 family)
MNLPDWITRDSDGYLHFTGHRIGLEDVIYHHATDGESPEMLHCRFPTLPLSVLYKTIAFYLDNRAEVDEYCAQEAAAVAQQRACAPKGPSTEEMRRRLELKRPAKGA